MIEEYVLNVCFLLTFLFVYAKWFICRPLTAASPFPVRQKAAIVIVVFGALLFPLAWIDWSADDPLSMDLNHALAALAALIGGMASSAAACLAVLRRIDAIRNRLMLNEHRMLRDMELARRIQQSVLPAAAESACITIKGLHIPSGQVSGDMYMWRLVQGNKALIILTDVMGHGVSSSLVSMYIHAYLQSMPENVIDPVDIVNQLNMRLCGLFQTEADGGGAMYCTAVCLLADARRRQVEYVNAGHPYGMMLSDGESFDELVQGGITLGIDAKADFQRGTAAFRRNARIILFTDGLFEVYGASPAATSQRMKELLEACGGLDTDCLIRELANELSQGSHMPDDICVIALDIKEA